MTNKEYLLSIIMQKTELAAENCILTFKDWYEQNLDIISDDLYDEAKEKLAIKFPDNGIFK